MMKRLLCLLSVVVVASAGLSERRSGIRGGNSIHNQQQYIDKNLPVNVLERRTRDAESQELPEQEEDDRRLDHGGNGYYGDDDNRKPCTYYYGDTRKSKFNGYDDDWYDDCKTESSNGPPSQQEAVQAPGGPAPTPYPTLALPPFLFEEWEDPNAAELPPGTFALPTKPPTRRPTSQPTLPPTSAATPQPTPTAAFPTDGPVDSSIGVPTFPPKDVIQDGAVDGENPPDINDTPPPLFQADDDNDDEDAACDAARQGQVYETTMSHTVYFQYELLTTPTADWQGVVWPAVDASFGQYVAKEMVTCDDDDEETVIASSSNTIVRGISPDPQDSHGTYTAMEWMNENNSTCTHLRQPKDLICDTVTGSITVFFDETEYVNLENVNAFHLQVQNEVYRLLQDAINDNRRRQLQWRGQQQHHRQMKKNEFINEDNAIYGLYFVSEPFEELDDASSAAGGPSLTDGIQDPSGGGGDTEQTLEASSRNVTPAVAASLAGLTMFVMLGVAFVIHRNRRSSDEELTDSTFVKPIQTKSLSLDGSEFDNHESPVYETRDDDYDEEDDLPMRTMNTTTDSDSFPIQDTPNPFRELSSIQQQDDTLYSPEPEMSRTRSLGEISRSNVEEVESPEDYTAYDERDVPPSSARRLSFSNQEEYTPTSTSQAPTACSSTSLSESDQYVETPNTGYRTMYTVEETVDEEDDFDFSGDGISMRLTSPELADSAAPIMALHPIHQRSRAMQQYERDPPEDQRQDRRLQSQELKVLSSILTNEKYESPSKASLASVRSPSTPSSEQWTTRTISVGNSASTSLIMRAANQILKREEEHLGGESSTLTSGAAYSVDPSDGSVVSLGSSVEPPPSMASSAISATPVLNGHMNSTVAETPMPRGVSRSQVANAAPYSVRSGQTTKSGRGFSFMSLESLLAAKKSRKPVDHQSPESTPKSLPRMDPPGSSESSRIDPEGERTDSPASQTSSSSRSEYLKERRRAMEERFQSYKSRLSDSMAKEGGSYLTLDDEISPRVDKREIPSPMDAKENFANRDEYSENESPSKRCFNMTGDNDKDAGAFPKPEERKTRAAVQQSPRRRRSRSRTPKKSRTPKSKREYAPLNEIEDMLDQDQEWMMQSDEQEAMRIDAFVSTRSRAASLDETMPEESKHAMVSSPSSPYTPRMDTRRINPEYTSDTVQL